MCITTICTIYRMEDWNCLHTTAEEKMIKSAQAEKCRPGLVSPKTEEEIFDRQKTEFWQEKNV